MSKGKSVTRASSKVVANGLTAKVPIAVQKTDEYGFKIYYEVEALYEDESLKVQLTAQKVASIIQRALHLNTVLFNFNSKTFKSTFEAYKAIEKEVGPIKVIRPISKYENQRRRGLIIVAKFREEQDAIQVIKEGISSEGIQYRGPPSNSGAENRLTNDG
jgi:hypothetical protein